MGNKNHWALVFWTVCEGLCPLMTQLTLESLNQPSRLRTMLAIMIIHICYTNQNMITMIRWRDLYVKSKWLLCCSMNTVFFPHQFFLAKPGVLLPSQITFCPNEASVFFAFLPAGLQSDLQFIHVNFRLSPGLQIYLEARQRSCSPPCYGWVHLHEV